MRGYMTVQQAFECGLDGSPFIYGEFNMIFETKRTLMSYNHLGLSYNQINSDKWQVKKAEPKVLTFAEWKNKESDGYGDLCFYDIEYECFNAGHKNGRLERDLEYKELLKAVEELTTVLPNSKYLLPETRTIVKIYNRLKPLNPDV